MPTVSMNKAKGIHTNNSFFSEVPEGSLQEANNVNVDRPGMIESRRGLKQYGAIGVNNSDTAKQLITYKNRVLAHYGSAIAFDNGSGLFTDFTASFTETESGLRIKFIEQNGNLYLTTSTGIRKISASSDVTLGSATISDSGGIKAVGGTAVVNYNSFGFFEGYSKVAYRIVWGTKDANNNLILGSPSMPIEVINQNPNSGTVDLTFSVPQGINTNYFYRIYRTAVFTAATFNDIQNIIVNDEYNLVYEEAYVSGTSITVNDIVPEDFREGGVPLYTNAISGEGILQANEPPPFAKDIAEYKNSAFYANTRTKHKLLIDLIGATNIRRYGSVTDSIDITNISYSAPNTTITFSANPQIAVGKKILITGSGSVTLDGIHTVSSASANNIVVVANGTGASAANATIYPSYITVTKGVNSDDYYFVGKPEINEVTFPAYYPAIAQKYFILSSGNNTNEYVVYFHHTPDPVVTPSNSETEGKIIIKVNVTNTDNTPTLIAEKVKEAIEANSYDFTIEQTAGTLRFICTDSGPASNPVIATINPVAGISTTNIQNGETEDAALGYIKLSSLPSPSQRIDDTARSLVNVITANSSGDVNVYYISGPNDAPGKLYFESRVLDTTPFTVIASDSYVGSSFNPSITTAQTSENEVKPNRVYFSKTSQPEAVPIVNYFDVGPQDKKILRIIGLRDSLFIMKEEGIYRLTGENPGNFFVTLFDNSANLIAPDTCAIINNQIYALSSQGVCRISETGIDIISQPVNDKIKLYSSPSYVNFKTASFACPYVQDECYILWMPAKPNDTTGTVAFRFSTETETWTNWTKTGNAKCAIVETNANKLYVGPDDDNIIEIERKDLTRNDFADRQYTVSIGNNSIDGLTIQLSSVANISVGDALVQSQYVTDAVITRLARKFALDSGVPNTISNSNKDYYRNFSIVPGDNLQTKLTTLITQLNSDLSSSFNTLYSSDIITFKNEYNALVGALNLSPQLLHTNYLEANILNDFELSVVEINKNNNTVTVELMQPIAVGDLTHYKAIECTIVYNPFFFGDPAVLKHVRDATVMFLDAGITRAKVAFNTDLSANFEEIPYTMEGVGNWGAWLFGSVTWGGEGSGRPFRTLIPKQKQRCRYIRTKLIHNSAFDDFKVLGISYTFRANSERAYK